MNVPAVFDEFMTLKTRLLEANINIDELRPFVISQEEYYDLVNYMQPYLYHVTGGIITYESIHGIKFKVLR